MSSLVNFNCHHNRDTDSLPAPTKKYFNPQYNLVRLKTFNDTISFTLDDSTFNAIKSFNLFSVNNQEYISFFDERSLAINIYDFESKKKIKNISVKKYLKGHKIYKPTTHVLNFDSIFVSNNQTLYLLDHLGTVKNKIDFLPTPPLAWAIFENSTPPIFKDNNLYASVRPYVNDESTSALNEWKVLYEFELKKNKAKLHYHFPKFLQKDLYGTRMLNHSYCYNDRGHFVFSFPADSAIYETNLKDYHVAYSAKSTFQHSTIPPMSEKEMEEEGSRKYMIRDSYGAIYFDPYKKRYLRVAQKKLSDDEYNAKKRKEQHIIILNEQLQIIGESPIDSGLSLNSIFITKKGAIYARILRQDEYNLHYIRLSYEETNSESTPIAKK